ncbi:MAG: PIG-L family deacetylase [Calditrichaeota bacterium]|nr:MAG: PIG-L family deacetylase [Calditrichota bacterium]
MKDIQTILILGPHTDDGEFGCGGSIAKFVEEGKDVYYATFSIAEESVPEGLPKDILLTEVKKASRELGIKKENLINFRYRVRHFPQFRQDILEDLVKLRKELQPDLVFLPSNDDVHQDHQTIYEEGLRAFKFTRILGYEMPWNNLTVTTNAFIFLEDRHIERKIAAIGCYESQVNAGRRYANEEFIRSLARTRGVQCGVHYAEAFQIIRWLII